MLVKKKYGKEDYEILEQIGDGSFGSVYRAKRVYTHELVAIKVMKKKMSRNQLDGSTLSECRVLKRIPVHMNIVQLYETFSTPSKDVYCVMEYMNGGNLYQLIEERKESKKMFEIAETKDIIFQIFKALAHIHHHGIFHRDIKPENLLINNEDSGNIIIKLADFGLAREFKSRPPYTDYVSTRWYRAPEVLLKATNYTSAIDLWAVGTIFAEIITFQPLFPGQSEMDQLFKICQVLGSPGSLIQKRKSRSDRLNAGFMSSKVISTDYVGIGGPWKEGLKLAHKIGFQFPVISHPQSLAEIINNQELPDEGIALMESLLQFDPCRRISSADALLHPFFRNNTEKSELFDLPVIPLSPLHVDYHWELLPSPPVTHTPPAENADNDMYYIFNNLHHYSVHNDHSNIPKSIEEASLKNYHHSTISRTISFPSIYNHSISVSLDENTVIKRSVSDSTLATSNIEVNIQPEQPQLQQRKANKLKLWVEKYGFGSVFHGGKSFVNT